jgi:fructose-bisphosphate aldolase class II
MTAASLKDVLQPAMNEGRAVAGLVVLGWEEAKAYVQAGEETGIPIILQAGPGCRKHTPVPILGKMFRHLADQASFFNDTATTEIYTLEECVQGIENGFTSVMFDGSKLPVSENIDITAGIAEKARVTGVSVEGEVGFVGYAEGAASAMTSPEDAARFDRESGADALAVSVGNVHLQTDKTAGIDFEALAAIEKVTHLPLVLPGGSGIPVETRRRLARESRVCKLNIGTELRMAFGDALRKALADNPDSFDRVTLLSPTIEAVKQATMDVIGALNGEQV